MSAPGTSDQQTIIGARFELCGLPNLLPAQPIFRKSDNTWVLEQALHEHFHSDGKNYWLLWHGDREACLVKRPFSDVLSFIRRPGADQMTFYLHLHRYTNKRTPRSTGKQAEENRRTNNSASDSRRIESNEETAHSQAPNNDGERNGSNTTSNDQLPECAPHAGNGAVQHISAVVQFLLEDDEFSLASTIWNDTTLELQPDDPVQELMDAIQYLVVCNLEQDQRILDFLVSGSRELHFRLQFNDKRDDCVDFDQNGKIHVQHTGDLFKTSSRLRESTSLIVNITTSQSASTSPNAACRVQIDWKEPFTY